MRHEPSEREQDRYLAFRWVQAQPVAGRVGHRVTQAGDPARFRLLPLLAAAYVSHRTADKERER